MWPPEHLNPHPLRAPEGKPLNHPANIELAYQGLADTRQTPLEALAPILQANFLRLFGPKMI